MIVLVTVACILALFLIAILVRRLHHWLISLEDRGYIYYRTSPRGGAGNAFLELDRLRRPSVEYVQQAMEREVESQENQGE